MAEPTTQTTKPFNRWIIVIIAMLVQFALGILYSYPFLLKPVMRYVDSVTALATNYTDPTLLMQGLLPYGIAVLFFAVGMLPAGRWQDKVGPKKVALTGSIVLLTGHVLAGISTMFPSGGSSIGMILTWGVIGGLGIGLVYVCPIACATKWFPDKVGLINGLAVAGFGAGSIVFNFIYNFLEISASLLVGGFIIGGLALAGAFVLHNPPAGYKPVGWEPPAPKAGAIVVENWTTKEMVHTKTFPMLWIMFFCSAICGLMVIGNFKNYGGTIDPFLSTSAVYLGILLGAANASGRIVWGKLSDKIGGIKTMRIMFCIQGVAMLLFAMNNLYMWYIFSCVIYFCFGGNLALFPATTRKFYGPKNMGLNYGLVFSAYGVAGTAGALLALPLVAAMGGNYAGFFIIFGCMSFVSFAVSFKTQPPERKAA